MARIKRIKIESDGDKYISLEGFAPKKIDEWALAADKIKDLFECLATDIEITRKKIKNPDISEETKGALRQVLKRDKMFLGDLKDIYKLM
jgi:hypothetical protein